MPKITLETPQGRWTFDMLAVNASMQLWRQVQEVMSARIMEAFLIESNLLRFDKED